MPRALFDRPIVASLAIGVFAAAALLVLASPVRSDSHEVDAEQVGSAATGSSRYTECIALTLYTYRPGDERAEEEVVEKTTPIPDGWTPVAGATSGRGPVVVVCR